MGKTVQNAFTLVELLVVISIITFAGIFTIANYSSFGKNQDLISAGLDVQNLLRQAQANATANAVCNTLTGARWQVIFDLANATSVIMQCQEFSLISPTPSPIIRKTIPLPANITITELLGIGTGCSVSSPVTISYLPVSGIVDFLPAACTGLQVKLINRAGDTKSVIIEKGGRIYE